MSDRLTFWLGAEAETIWTAHIEEVQRSAEEMRCMQEAVDE